MNRTLGLSALLWLAACGPVATPAPEPVAAPAPAPEAVAEASQPTEPRPLPDASRLIGLNPVEVQRLMREPTLVRREGSVQVALFENAACVLEVIFYEPRPDAHFEATHVRARTRQGQDTDTGACLATLLPGGAWPAE